MEKRTIVSGSILFVLLSLILGFSIVAPGFWIKYLSHWTTPPAIALIMTLLVGLMLMDNLFELDDTVVITPKKLKLKIEIRKYLVWAFLIVCSVSIILEVVQFSLSLSNTRWLDPLTAMAGAIFGIILHIFGSKWIMKRVEFELDRWESNVL